MNKLSLLPAAILTLCISQAAFAQTTETGSTTATGALRTTKQIVADIRALIPDKKPLKLKEVTVKEQEFKAWMNESVNARERLLNHRKDCRDAIRKANRDQLMNRITQCYRSDLLQDVNILRKQSDYIKNIPLLTPLVRTSATGAIAKLVDAEMTIIDAIDTGLFTRPEGMQEAKKNLRVTYREPVWEALLDVRADQQLTWIDYIVNRIDERTTTVERKDAIGFMLKDAATCLENAANSFISALSASGRLLSADMYHAGLAENLACRKTLVRVAQKERQEEAEKTAEALKKN